MLLINAYIWDGKKQFTDNFVKHHLGFWSHYSIRRLNSIVVPFAIVPKSICSDKGSV